MWGRGEGRHFPFEKSIFPRKHSWNSKPWNVVIEFSPSSFVILLLLTFVRLEKRRQLHMFFFALSIHCLETRSFEVCSSGYKITFARDSKSVLGSYYATAQHSKSSSRYSTVSHLLEFWLLFTVRRGETFCFYSYGWNWRYFNL